jgi:capsid protein
MSNSPYVGGEYSRTFSDWVQRLWESNDATAIDGRSLSARAWDLYRNGPYARAMVATLVDGILGPLALPWRSTYQGDTSAETSDAERKIRRDFEDAVRRATRGKRFDAGGMLTFRSMLAVGLTARIVHGDGWLAKVSKPGRPGSTRDLCGRIVDPARIENKDQASDMPGSIGGMRLNASGDAYAITIRSRHPNQIRPSDKPDSWEDYPLFDANGRPLILQLKKSDQIDQHRGVSEFASNIRVLKFLEDVTYYWVVAKKLQASNCIIVECKDPAAAAKADKNGAVLAGSVGIKPGMKYYVEIGQKVHLVNHQFQGADYIQFRNANLAAACAPWKMPYELVLGVLTGTNLSASRAALGQYEMSLLTDRAEFISQWLQPIIEWILEEEVTRGFVAVPSDYEVDAICRGRFLPPPKISPDRYKDMLTVELADKLGVSKSTSRGWLGLDHEEETTERVQNDNFDKAQGLVLTEPTSVTTPIVTDEDEVPPGGEGATDEQGGGENPTDNVEEEEPAAQGTPA